MRVLVLHSSYASGAASGENRVVEDEVRLLREAGHDVELHAPSASAVSKTRAGINAVWSAQALRGLRRALLAFRPDVVHCHNLFPMLSPAVLREAASRVAVVMTLHNFRLLCLPATLLRGGVVCEDCLGRGLWRGVVHGCYRRSRLASAALAGSLGLHSTIKSFDRVSLFAAVSRFLSEKLVQGGLDAGRIRVRHNFSWAMDRRRGPGSDFLLLGRLSPEKGFDTVLRAWQGRGRLLVVGDGPERERLEALGSPGVRFHGAVKSREVPGLLANARAVMMPSRGYEGSPRVLIEAFAAGVPVIASKIGGLPEHVADGVSGMLVEPNDLGGWSAAIEHLLDDDVSLHLGEGAYTRWKRQFSPAVSLRNLLMLYGAAIPRGMC